MRVLHSDGHVNITTKEPIASNATESLLQLKAGPRTMNTLSTVKLE